MHKKNEPLLIMIYIVIICFATFEFYITKIE